MLEIEAGLEKFEYVLNEKDKDGVSTIKKDIV